MERDIILDSKMLQSINFVPQTVLEEIMQNVRTIVTTLKFSVPLDRDFGVAGEVVDSPVDESVQARLQAEIFEAVRRYEPRVEILQIRFSGEGSDGRILPIVRIRIKEGYINEI